MQVLLVGQLPPPYHGQAMVNQTLSTGAFDRLTLRTLRLNTSRSMDEIGKLGLRKVARLLGEANVLRRMLKDDPTDVVVFSLGAGSRSALYRDTLILKLIERSGVPWAFHVHSAGIDAYLSELRPVERKLATRAFSRASGIIRLAEGIGQLDSLPTRWSAVLANAVPDRPHRDRVRGESKPVNISFVGNLYPTKGVDQLLEAVAKLRESGRDVRATFVGASVDGWPVERWRAHAARMNLDKDAVRFTGQLSPDETAQTVEQSDIFCFPTRYELEAMPLVVIEAMRAGVPVVSTTWRAVPQLVEHGVTGLLSAPNDLPSLIANLAELIDDCSRREAMGDAGRRRYLDRHTVEVFLASFERHMFDFAAVCKRPSL